ncbi:uncharacterized protein [Asterias amurensis]|uniref:uncharacterized protein n=1 Tax=Asterias amurensis TaxID=7602 RepID=UPI003AB49F88
MVQQSVFWSRFWLLVARRYCMYSMMQQEGRVQFLKYHLGTVRGVAFCPKDRYLFCSGAFDGRVNLYTAQKCILLQSYSVTTFSLARNIHAVRFTSDGRKILATTSAGRLAVVDVETGAQLITYESCAFNRKDRTGLAVDPKCPNTVVCTCVNGKGLAVFDLRMSIPRLYIYDLHSDIIRDVTFLGDSWPWCSGETTFVTASVDGHGKVVTLDGRTLLDISAGTVLQCVDPTPGPYNAMEEDGFCSVVMLGGGEVCAYLPHAGVQETLKQSGEDAIWKLKYTSNGSMLYTACEKGVIRRYRRYPDRHEYLGEVFRHKADVQDMDISPYDEYLVTASKDRSVGIIKLGLPNHGCTEYGEFT